MEHNTKKVIFDRDISIEEFDHITDGVEDYVFSDEYLAGKESMMRNSTKAKISKLGVKIAAAAAAVVVASPFVVNAAMGGELFNRLWGNEGKKTVESHQATFIEDGKIDDKGNPVIHNVTMPKIEYVAQDPEVAARLLAGKYTTTPVSATIGDTKITVETVVRDGMGIVAAYTVEREGGVKCFNYSQIDNEAKGAWFSEDQNIVFGFDEGTGKIWVDLERSTDTKLYCYEYMFDNSAMNPDLYSPITDHITLNCQEFTDTRANIAKTQREKGVTSYIKDSKSITIPVADKLDSKTFKSEDGTTIKISPIAMQWDSTGGKSPKGEPLDSVKKFKITFKDGSEYLVYEFDKVASYGYICGGPTGFIVLFNRLVDTDNIAKITINNVEYKA